MSLSKYRLSSLGDKIEAKENEKVEKVKEEEVEDVEIKKKGRRLNK